MSSLTHIFHQPRSVKAITFACVVSYMGVGLVDPILPEIAASLNATPGQTELLFTTYLFTTAVMMFFSSWISSRIGAKRTLLTGLGLVVAFALACSLAGSVNHIIGFRAGWGVGNALFVSTALAAIVGASADTRSAVVLYEAALGLGMAVGPLAGGTLGNISWRGPFAGTAVLMLIGLIGVMVSVAPTPPTRAHVDVMAPFRALRRRDFLPVLSSSFFYNYGYFTILAFAPFPIAAAAAAHGHTFTPLHLGLIFFVWGLFLAIASVVLAPRLSQWLGVTRALLVTLGLLAVDEVIFFVATNTVWIVVAATLISGLLLGVANTVMTEASMEATDLPRQVASSSYSGVRFFGAALAPAMTGPLSELGGLGLPFAVGAVTMVIAMGCLLLNRPQVKD